MKIKYGTTICLGIFLMLISMGTATAETITVDESGGADYTLIQAAVDAASDGDTILVSPGTYTENVIVSKKLDLKSTSGATVTNVVAASSDKHIIIVTADEVTISGFNMTGTTTPNTAAIYLSSNNNALTNNIITKNNIGIYMKNSNYNTLTNNVFSYNAIAVWMERYCNYNTFSNNMLLRNSYGFDLGYQCKHNTFTRNNVQYNGYGVKATFNSDYNIIEDNYFANSGGPSGGDGIFLSYCTNNIIANNTISDNALGIRLSYCSNNLLTNNTVSNSKYFDGIFLYYSNYNTFTNNKIVGSRYSGIFLNRANDNKIFNNYFSNNVNVKFYSSTGNVWNSTEVNAYAYNDKIYVNYTGNYFSNYQGSDSNGDGIGDTPYGSIDYYPLLFWPVTAVPPNQAPIINASTSYTGYEGLPITFDLSASSDPDGDILTYKWDFNNNGTWDFESSEPTASYTWDDDYTGTVTLEVSDGKLSDTVSTTVVINNVAPSTTISSDVINENGTAKINGVISDSGIEDTFDVTIAWGDVSNQTVSYPAGTTAFSVNHQYLDDDPSGTSFDNYSVTVTVSDDDGGIGSASSIVIVNNIAPEIISLSSPIDPVAVNETVAISSDFIDVGTLDTHTVTIDWGDSSVDAMELSVSSVSDDQTTHSYLDAGVYRITVTVTDDDGGFDTITSEQYIVVYDPDAGFVTGGGWIDSLSGAYTPDNTDDEDLVGKATFGFVSKYKKGATVPTGNTEFQFKVADLNFKSTNYDWLVIAGSKAQYKGTGTINGEGNYGFMLSAIDAGLTPSTDVDLFRIKIWDKDNDGEIIYDNMLGADETTDPTTAIQGGSIKIHKEK